MYYTKNIPLELDGKYLNAKFDVHATILILRNVRIARSINNDRPISVIIINK